MKFAIRVPGSMLYPNLTSPWERSIGWREILRFARRADALGFDWLWMSEHLVQDADWVPMMGGRFFEGVSACAVLLGATERIGALPYVAVLPYHDPIAYAKAVASVDFLSGGRLALGLGAGYMQREFDALGIRISERGRRFDESLRVMRELWTQDRPRFEGEFFRFDGVVFEPKPVQRPHPPLLVGGDSLPAQRRAARLGDGWLPWLTSRAELPARLAYIEEVRRQETERDPSRAFHVLALLADFPAEDHLDSSDFRVPRETAEARECLAELEEAGATGAIVHLPETRSLDECLDWLERFAAEVVSPAARDELRKRERK